MNAFLRNPARSTILNIEQAFRVKMCFYENKTFLPPDL